MDGSISGSALTKFATQCHTAPDFINKDQNLLRQGLGTGGRSDF